MGTIELKKDALVFYKNQQHKIFRIINFNKVSIEDLETNEIIDVALNELSSQKVDIESSKKYFDDYSDQEWEEATKRYEIIKDLVFIKRTRKEVEDAGKKAGYSVVTLYKWIDLYEQTNELSSLVPLTSKRGKKGSRLENKIDNIIDEVLEDLFLNKQKYSFKRIYNRIYQECKKNNLQTPHENTIRNRIEDIDPRVATKRRHGYKEAQKLYDNFEGEFPEGKYPLDFVQIDHTPLDIMLVDKLHRKPLDRPYLTLAIDVYSRMICGFYLSLQAPGYYNVSQCLYSIFTQKDKTLLKNQVEGEWNIFGVPRVIGVDNGADLVSADMQRVCDEYGILLQKRPVARPQFGAHVERVLGTINKEVHNLAGTTFSNIGERGTYDSKKEATYTIGELTQWLLFYIVNIYHKKYHAGIGTSPEEKYVQGIFGDDETAGTGILPSIIDNTEHIRISLLPTEFRTVQKDGITLDGITYYSDVLRHWIGKKDSNKSKIKHKIKRDPWNIQKIYFYDPELKEYFEVPYRKLSAPVMTLWDLYAAKRYLKEKNISNYTEDDIFDAYVKLEKLEERVQIKHSKHKKSKPSTINKIEKKEAKDINSFESLFNDIELFDVKHKGINYEED